MPSLSAAEVDAFARDCAAAAFGGIDAGSNDPPQHDLGLPLLHAAEPASPARLSLGSDVLDAAVGGGIRLSGVTEVFGEAAAGKTQFCLHLLLRSQLPVRQVDPGGAGEVGVSGA